MTPKFNESTKMFEVEVIRTESVCPRNEFKKMLLQNYDSGTHEMTGELFRAQGNNLLIMPIYVPPAGARGWPIAIFKTVLQFIEKYPKCYVVGHYYMDNQDRKYAFGIALS